MTFRTVSIKARDAKVGDLIHSLRAGPYVQETLSSIDYMGYVSNSDPYLLKLRPYLAVGNDEEINNAAHLLHLAGPLVKDASEIQLVKGLQRKVYRLEFDADTPQLIHPDRLTLVRDYLLQQMHLDRLGGLMASGREDESSNVSLSEVLDKIYTIAPSLKPEEEGK